MAQPTFGEFLDRYGRADGHPVIDLDTADQQRHTFIVAFAGGASRRSFRSSGWPPARTASTCASTSTRSSTSWPQGRACTAWKTAPATKASRTPPAAPTAHVQALAGYFGPGSREHLEASNSWLAALSRLLSIGLRADTRVRRDGNLSLLAHTGSGYTYALIFHGATRRCTAGDDCTATIADDGTAHAVYATAVLADHTHQPSFPPHAPRPGSWSLHC